MSTYVELKGFCNSKFLEQLAPSKSSKCKTNILYVSKLRMISIFPFKKPIIDVKATLQTYLDG